MNLFRILFLALLLPCLQQTVLAQQSYPNRPIRVIVPYPAGESVDVIARLLAARLSPLLGQQVIVDNRGGGGGVIGAALAAQATPDGYNLLYGNVGAIVIAPNLQPKPPYDALRNFTPVSEIAPLHEALGLETITVAGVEPVIAANDENYNNLQGKQRQRWLDLLYEISAEPSIVGASRHLLYVGKKK